jgi:hypothetical protein
MKIKTVQDAFVEFEREKVRVPAWQNDQAKHVHPLVRDAVHEALGDRFLRSFLAGSYRRKVQTVRLHDVDMVVVLKDLDGRLAASASFALELLKAAAETPPLVVGCETSVRAVKLEIDGVEFSVDLVAALDDPAGEVRLARHIPEEGFDDWTRARPEGQTRASAEKNVATDGIYVPTVRVVKFWNQRRGDGEKNLLPSYLAESIVYHALEEACDFDVACAAFFRLAAAHLASPAPSVSCPGDPGNFVDERLETERRVRALAQVEADLTHVAAAETATDPGAALDAWAQIFGPAFPAPSTDASKLAESLRPEIAFAGGPGISRSGAGRQVIPARSWRRLP